MNKAISAILIPAIYLSAVVCSYALDLNTVLNILSLPWSYPLMLFSGLIIHMTVKGAAQMDIAKIVGACLNVILYLLWIYRSKNNVPEIPNK